LVAAIAGLALAAAPLTGCGWLDPGPEGRVLVIGDSLTVGAQEQGLGDGHSWDWTIRAVVGLTTAQAASAAAGFDPGRYDLVVVALGTNDARDDEATYGARIDDMMAALGDADQVLWVNVDAQTTELASAAEGVNPAIDAAENRHPNLEVADWDAYVRGREDMDDLRAGDGVHYNAAGYQVRAGWMEGLVEP
jgi:lysophospholipase L1-like esterase